MLRSIINLELSRNKQNVINIVAGIANMLVTTLISFFLSPYIVGTLGVEANGFVTLANNFISYGMLAKTALNSMGSRFIMLAYYKDEHDKVEKYYSSLFIGDLVLGVVMGIIGAVCVWKLESFLVIPEHLVSDVKVLFALLFTSFVVSTVVTVWSVAPYVKNRLYLDSATNAISAVLRAVIIFGLFMSFSPTVSFVGVGTLVSGLIGCLLNMLYKRHLFPSLRVNVRNFSWKAIKTLVSSGVWNTVSSLGSILTNGLDLLVANITVGDTAMGVLSVAKTMPVFVSTLNETIANVFTPSLIIDYAKDQAQNIVKTVKQSSKMISVICSLPLGFLLVYGEEFYALWQPTQEARTLYILSTITIFGRVFFTGMQPLFNVFTVVNKVKQNSIVTIVTGLVSVALTLLMLKTTNLGIYAIAGVSVVCCFIKNMVFVIPFSAKYLGLKMTTFYYTLVPSVLSSLVLCVWGFILKMVIAGNSWITLIAAGFVFCVVGVLLTSLIVLNKDERAYLISMIKTKLKIN